MFSRGGGVAILIKENFYVTLTPQVIGAEALWCKIATGKSYLYLGTVYLPPNACNDIVHALANFVEAHLTQTTEIILTGDFNFAGIT